MGVAKFKLVVPAVAGTKLIAEVVLAPTEIEAGLPVIVPTLVFELVTATGTAPGACGPKFWNHVYQVSVPGVSTTK